MALVRIGAKLAALVVPSQLSFLTRKLSALLSILITFILYSKFMNRLSP